MNILIEDALYGELDYSILMSNIGQSETRCNTSMAFESNLFKSPIEINWKELTTSTATA